MTTIKNIKSVDQNVVRVVAAWLSAEFPYDVRYATVDSAVAELSTRNNTLIAFDGETPVGTISLVDQDDIPSDLRGWVADLFVAEDHRRRGHAAVLLEAIVTHAKAAGNETIYLYTDAQEAYYAKRGWETIERTIHPESKKEIAIMQK